MQIGDEEYQGIFKEVYKISSLHRGIFLNEFSFLEIMIDGFLAYHFCNSDKNIKDFLQMIMRSDVIIFERKRTIFKKIIELYYPDFIKKKPKFHAALGAFADYRNQIAHYQLDLTPEAMEKCKTGQSIFLLDSTKRTMEFPIQELLDMVKEIKEMANEISKMIPTEQTSPSI